MLRKNLDDLDTNGRKGDWCFIENDSHIALRYGDDMLMGLVILPISQKSRSDMICWVWNGDRDKPTLNPSINVEEVPGWNEGWHGFLRDGKLIDA